MTPILLQQQVTYMFGMEQLGLTLVQLLGLQALPVQQVQPDLQVHEVLTALLVVTVRLDLLEQLEQPDLLDLHQL
jgi:hypothetical protein